MSRSSRPLVLLVLLLAAACGPPAREPLDAGPDVPDPPDDPCVACAADELCVDDACVPLPDDCPCPTGSYCDLDANRCVVGCTVDDHCAATAYCDLVERGCRSGCRIDDDCPGDDLCTDHACVDACAGVTCPDDGDPCTRQLCRAGACIDEDVPEGGACPDDGVACTKDECRGGACVHPTSAPGTACADDGNPCTTDTCQDGACVHPAGNDFEVCGFGICLDGVCGGLSTTSCWYDEGTGYWILAPPEGESFYVTFCGCVFDDGSWWLVSSLYEYQCLTECTASGSEYLCL